MRERFIESEKDRITQGYKEKRKREWRKKGRTEERLGSPIASGYFEIK
jgi:hypothetical protein